MVLPLFDGCIEHVLKVRVVTFLLKMFRQLTVLLKMFSAVTDLLRANSTKHHALVYIHKFNRNVAPKIMSCYVFVCKSVTKCAYASTYLISLFYCYYYYYLTPQIVYVLEKNYHYYILYVYILDIIRSTFSIDSFLPTVRIVDVVSPAFSRW